MPSLRPLPPLLFALALVGGLAGCGDDGPTTTSASTVPEALAAQGARGGQASPAPRGPRIAGDADLRRATAPEAAAVRAGFRAFADAFVARDARTACSHAVGFEELLRARGQSGTCEELLPAIGNTSAGPSPRDVALIDDADVEVAGDVATVSVGSEAPVPMRRDGGTWKLDYAAFAATPKDR